jgi:hypothetical protein
MGIGVASISAAAPTVPTAATAGGGTTVAQPTWAGELARDLEQRAMAQQGSPVALGPDSCASVVLAGAACILARLLYKTHRRLENHSKD